MARSTCRNSAQRVGVLAAMLSLFCVGSLCATDASQGNQSVELARQILRAAGVQGGLIVHLGCGGGRLTAALRANDRYIVRGLDADPASVETSRGSITAGGVYGPVSVEHCPKANLPFAENLVNLLVVSSNRAGVPWSEMFRVLAPGGAAVMAEGASRGADSEGANVQKVTLGGELWLVFRKPWPSNIDQWTHWLHGADGNPVAHDTVVGPPRQMQWWASPVWSRSHEKSPSLTGMVSAGGRLFYICDEGPADIGGPLPDRWQLVARDAFNGVLLWKLPVSDWGWKAWSPNEPMNLRWGNPRFIHRRLVADGDRVYVTLGYSAAVSALDAATGEVVRVFAGTENTCEILCHEQRLVLSVATEPKTATDKAPPLKILALEADTGKRLWEAGPFPSLYDLGERGKENVLKQGHVMVAAAEDGVYCVTDRDILAFRLGDGKQAWQVPRPPVVMPDGDEKTIRAAASKLIHNLGSLMVSEGRVYYAQPDASAKRAANNVPMTLLCLAADTGQEQWRRSCGDWSYTTSLNVYAAGGLIWVHDDPKEKPYDLLGLRPETGEVQVRHDIASVLTTKHHHRCYRNKATDNFLLMGKEGVECIDLASGTAIPNRWMRGMCLYGIMPANGLLYVPPHACSCNPMTMLQGYWALAPASVKAAIPLTPATARLEKGPAYSEPFDRAGANAEDWPTYRHDPMRSGAANCEVSPQLSPRWQLELGGKLTAPIAVDGRVYLGRTDAHEIVALGAEQGKVVWRYRLGGPIDTPPTYHQGTLLAGCADGWVYCLGANDGRLRWRFQAAPGNRSVVVEERLESAWPVHGSTVIRDNIAYVAAGRSSYLDGGMRFCMLDPASGQLLQEKTLSTEQSQQEAYFDGLLSDVLVSNEEALYMRHKRLDPRTLELSTVESWQFNGPVRGKSGGETKSGSAAPPERHVYLRSGQGFLDDSLYGRTQFHLDGGEFCHLLCFDRDRCYGFQMSTHTGHFAFFTPGREGYSVLAFDRSRAGNRNWVAWKQKLPLRTYGMVLAGKHLVLAGAPDVVDPVDPLSSFEGRMGGRLVVLDTQTGMQMSDRQLEARPVLDSLIAVSGKVYLTDRSGRVLCLE